MKFNETNYDDVIEETYTGSFLCPYCGITMPVTDNTHSTRYPSFNFDKGKYYTHNGLFIEADCIALDFYACPKCKNFSIIASNCGDYYKKDFCISLYPTSFAKQYPTYIPQSIRDDYEEAYSISKLSPKASATLSRRCLQGMIRDFWNIKKSTLFEEINCLQDKVTHSQWKAINAIRSIGNIGAHMEKDINVIIDIDPDEAEKLLKLIELLIDKWYITRHDEEQLLNDIQNIAKDKSSKKSNQ